MLRVGLLVVGLLLLASPAFAQALPPDPAQLDYSRPKNLVACPEEWYFRAFVAGRFGGVDPFTPDAPRRIALTLGRRSGAFVATLDMYDSAGAYLGGNEKPLVGPDCQRIVDHAGGIVVAWLMPIVVPRRTPPPEPPQAEPAPVVPQPPPPPPPQPIPPKPEAAPIPLAPVELPKPGVFEGGAGFGRALLVGLSAGTLATGITSLAVADHSGNAARQLLGVLQQQVGSAPCLRTAPGLRDACEQVLELRQQQDRSGTLAIGSFVGTGLTAAAASIWILRTPTAPSIQVTPSAPGGRAGLTFQGSW